YLLALLAARLSCGSSLPGHSQLCRDEGAHGIQLLLNASYFAIDNRFSRKCILQYLLQALPLRRYHASELCKDSCFLHCWCFLRFCCSSGHLCSSAVKRALAQRTTNTNNRG